MLRKLTQDSAWLALAAILGRSSTLVASFLIVRWLGRDAYGLVALLQSTVLMAGGFVGLGFGMAATKLVAEYRDADPAKAGGVILLFELATILTACSAVCVLWFSRVWLASNFLGEPRILDLLAPGVILLVLTSWNLFQAGILAGLEEFRKTAQANAISGLVSIPMMIMGIMLAGLQGAVYAQLVGMFLSCILYSRWIGKACRAASIDRQWNTAYGCLSLLVKFGVPAMLLNAINAPTDWISFAILTRQATGVSEVAIFGAANQWCLLLRFLPLMMGSAILPMAAHAVEGRSLDECYRLLRTGLILSAAFAIPPAFIVALASSTIFLWYGEGFSQHWQVLAILAAASCFIAVQITAERFVLSFGAAWSSFYLGVIRSFIQIGLLGWFIESGAQGLAIARLIAFAFGAMACTMLAYHLLRRRYAQSNDYARYPASVATDSAQPVRAA